jgi:allantoicase
LIQESYGKDMGDGWETARHPFRPAIIVKDPVTDLVDSPLMDWAILKLGMGGILGGEEGGVSRIIIDTKHFRGNYPESVRLEGCCYNDESDLPDESYSTLSWFELIPRSRLGPDREHVFDRELQEIRNDRESVTHVRVSIFPDGGLSRIRIYGTPRHPK